MLHGAGVAWLVVVPGRRGVLFCARTSHVTDVSPQGAVESLDTEAQSKMVPVNGKHGALDLFVLRALSADVAGRGRKELAVASPWTREWKGRRYLDGADSGKCKARSEASSPRSVVSPPRRPPIS